MSRAYAASGLLAAGLVGVAFLARGGNQLGRNTLVEIALVAVGACMVAAAVLVGRRRGPAYGTFTVLLFGGLVALTALSAGWSVVPELSFVEAGRSFAYLAAFAGAVTAARLAPGASAVVLRGVLLAAVAVCAYALASRVWPGTLGENELYARLGQPFGYWNAVGAIAALGIVPALWVGARRAGGMLERALAFPAAGILILALLLTQSRGALAAVVVGAIVWFVFVPLRLRSLLVLAVGALGAAPVSAWALSKNAFAVNFTPLAERQAVAPEFGLLVALMVVGLLVAGLATSFGMGRLVPSMRVRRRVGLAAVLAVLAVPLALFTSVASSERGIGGAVSDRVDELTSETAAAPPEGAGRLTVSSSSRARYWREAFDVFGERPAKGTGAGAYYVSRLRYRKDELVARHAHGYVPQTASDLGVAGLVVSGLLLLSWAVTALRATGLSPRLRRRSRPRAPLEWTGERVALLGLVVVAVVFGVQSAVDWTWFVPGTAVTGLVAAGFVAGRGRIARAGPETTAAVVVEEPRAGWRRPPKLRAVGAAAVLATGALCAWATWQPERSTGAGDEAISKLERGELSAAADSAKAAQEADPLSPRPRFVQSSIAAAAGRDAVARRTLERTVIAFPGNPQTWLKLAAFELRAGEPRRALEVVRGALYLDPFSKSARTLRDQAMAAALAEIRRATRDPVKRRELAQREAPARSPAGGGSVGGGGGAVGAGGVAGTAAAGGSGGGGKGGDLRPAQGKAKIPPAFEAPAEYLD